MATVTGLVMAHNEEKNLEDCLSSLSFCDDIVVVLDKCTDRSREIALKHTKNIVEGSFEIEGERKKAGLLAVKTDWVFDLDADERVPFELAQEIREVITKSKADLHLVPVDNYVDQKLIRYGWGAYFGVMQRWGLYRLGAKSFGEDRVHPKLTLSGTKGEKLKNPLIHFVDNDITDMLARLNRYTSARAKDLVEKGVLEGKLPRETYGKNIRRIFSRFFKCYVMLKGYREGKWGFLIALCSGLYPILSYLKATLEGTRQRVSKP